jgi:hypothetical protein
MYKKMSFIDNHSGLKVYRLLATPQKFEWNLEFCYSCSYTYSRSLDIDVGLADSLVCLSM